MDRNVSHPSYIIFGLPGPFLRIGKVYDKMIKFLTKISIPTCIAACNTYDVMFQVTKVLAWSHVLAFQCQKSEQENI